LLLRRFWMARSDSDREATPLPPPSPRPAKAGRGRRERVRRGRLAIAVCDTRGALFRLPINEFLDSTSKNLPRCATPPAWGCMSIDWGQLWQTQLGAATAWTPAPRPDAARASHLAPARASCETQGGEETAPLDHAGRGAARGGPVLALSLARRARLGRRDDSQDDLGNLR